MRFVWVGNCVQVVAPQRICSRAKASSAQSVPANKEKAYYCAVPTPRATSSTAMTPASSPASGCE